MKNARISEEKIRQTQLEEAEQLAQLLAGKYQIPYVNLKTLPVDLDALQTLTEEESRTGGLVIFARVGKKIKLAVKNPTLNETLRLLDDLSRRGFVVEKYLASLPSLERAWARYQEITPTVTVTPGIIDVSVERLKKASTEITSLETLSTYITTAFDAKTITKATEVLEVILAGALQLDASDVHLEQGEKMALIRYRLDGVLHDISPLASEVYHLLLSRVKLISELKLNIHDRAQDGRFTIRLSDMDIEIRTSVLPGPYGESIVLRLLNPKTIQLNLEDLGIQGPVYEMLVKELTQPNGMILTTGPTGSGKTTTLYAFIKKIQSPDIKIITIENPIEYHLTGITQTQVDASGHYTFEKGLTAILRQDPDVILIGEIRNLETAETALHAALTGHLVFSTLHTNNAAGTVPRLIDMGVKPNVIAPSINVAIAQRLVRRLCACKEKSSLNDRELAYVETLLKTLPKAYKTPVLKNISTYRVKGCTKCNHIGYKGRLGIYEALKIDDTVEAIILKNPTEADFRHAAKSQGMLTMQQDGILKVLAGVTTMEEVERVTGELE